MFWGWLVAETHLQLVFVVVGDDRDPEVTVLSKQWSSLQLGAHLDPGLSLVTLLSYQTSDWRVMRVLILKW